MTISPTAEVAKVRLEASSITGPVLNTAGAITIVDSTDYSFADATLKRIRDTRKQVTNKFDPIIKPIFNSLNLLYKFRKELEDPLELAEKQLKSKMSTWQGNEKRRIEAENIAREEEAEEIRRRLAEKTAKAEVATRTSVKTALSNATTELAQKLVEIESQPMVTPSKAEYSNTRTTKKCEVVDMRAFLKAALDGEIPLDIVSVNQTLLDKCYRDSPTTVATWPGVTITETIQIVGR